MALQHSMTLPLSSCISPILVKERNLNMPNLFFGTSSLPRLKHGKFREKILNVGDFKAIREPTRVQAFRSDGDDWKRQQEASSDSDDDEPPHFDKNDPYCMSLEERKEWRRKIRDVINKKPDIPEQLDPVEKKKKLEKLLSDYPLVVEEEDPDWPEDSDGWGFSLGQFFDKITIKNTRKADDNDDDDEDNKIVWQDDDYIRPIKDIKTAEWEETVFKDISPLIILVHNRYKRPKENDRIRNELEKAVHIIWNCRLPSPRCVALDAIVETELVAALQVSVFPEIIFTKAGKILYREKAMQNADELSKIMAFFYYGAAKPSCLNGITDFQEDIPSIIIENSVS